MDIYNQSTHWGAKWARNAGPFILVHHSQGITTTTLRYFQWACLQDSVADPDQNPDPDPPVPHVFGPPGSGSISQRYGSGFGSGSGSFYHHAKIVRKTLILTILWLFLTFYLWKVPSKSNKQKKIVFVGILKVTDENSRIRIQDPDPDPLVRGMDPRIRIRINAKISWIRNTALNNKKRTFITLFIKVNCLFIN